MQHLIGYARTEGLDVLHGDVLAANTRMLQLCRELGFGADSSSSAADVVRVKLPLG
jgi:acetyltransferase